MKKSKTTKQTDLESVIKSQSKRLAFNPTAQQIANQTLVFLKYNERVLKVLQEINDAVEILARQKRRDLDEERKATG